MKWLFTILYGLMIIWTGLQRGIEAKAYKPNALWFCMVMGAVAIGAGFLYRMDKKFYATVAAMASIVFVLGFYMVCFITQPEKDATYRVGAIILASIGELVVVFLPSPPRKDRESQ